MSDWLNQRAQTDPQRQVWNDGQEQYSYKRLNTEAWELASRLANKIHPGDRLAILGLNSTFHLLAAFAAWRLGAILVPLNYRLSPRELEGVIGNCQPSLVLFDDAHADKLEGLTFDQILAQPATNQVTPREFVPADPALILYTSGTTGTPKGVILSHRMLMANIENTTNGWELTNADRSLLFAPLFHTGGWNVITLPLLHAGGHLTLMNTFEAPKVVNYIRQGEVTVLFGVPTMFEMIRDHWDLTPEESAPVRFFISGGAPCSLELIDKFLARGINFRQGFGMTEVGPNCFHFPADKVKTKAGTVGLPMPGTRVEILGDGEVGELAIGGDHIFSGYWKNPAATQTALEDGLMLTGDLAKKDKDGFFVIVGRRKEMFISGGENVYPAEVERELHGHPEVASAAVVGVADERWGEVGCAYIIANSHDLTASDLKAFLRERLAHYKVPKHYELVKEFPLNSTGKIQKPTLVEMFEKKK